MSAIAGLFRFDGRPVDRRDIERMLNALQAHGPDRRGLHTSADFGFGHLLMRMTPEDTFDAQPVRGASQTMMVADLRLDNRDELAAALGLDPERAIISSDSAILYAAWLKWGHDAWARLRGPFAVALWDARERRLVLARDPIGLSPLYYYQNETFFAFATMPKGLFALPDVPRELNKEKLADFLVLNHSDVESTVYRDIFRLAHGHAASLESGGKLSKTRFWGANNIRQVRLKSDQDYADAMRERLDVAVRRQLRTTSRVGCFLSGGLDSPSVAALAARALAEKGQRLHCYTQVPVKEFNKAATTKAYFDERPYVEAIRSMIDTLDVSYICSGEYDELTDLDQVFAACEGPVHNPQNLGWMMQVYRLARSSDERVLLTGGIGNLAPSWDGWEQAYDNLVRGRVWTALKQYRLRYELSTRSLLGTFRELFLQHSPLVDHRLVAFAKRPDYSAIAPEFANRMGVVERAKRDSRALSLGRDSLALSQRLNAITAIDSHGEWRTAMLAVHGVDTRDPTADLDLIEFCLGIPDDQYLVEGIDRSVIRRAMWGLIPHSVVNNHRRGAQAADWFEKLSKQRATMIAEIKNLRKSTLASEAIDLDRLEFLVDHFPTELPRSRLQQEAYMLALPRGLSTGRFLKLLERSNR